MYNTQKLLFDITKPITKNTEFSIPVDFYEKGYTLLKNIENIEDATKTVEHFIGNLDENRLPLIKRFKNKVQLAKADQIPFCDDSVCAICQALHYDMGQPFVSEESQLMMLFIALYIPGNQPAPTARTRVLGLKSLFKGKEYSYENIEAKMVDYIKKYGDGWEDTNTGRLACFGRVADAVTGANKLTDYRSKTMAQWFRDDKNVLESDTYKNEIEFYKSLGIDLGLLEEQVQIQPGEILIIDNTRAAHGRLGQRKTKEIYQLMYGVENATPEDIEEFRKYSIQEMLS